MRNKFVSIDAVKSNGRIMTKEITQRPLRIDVKRDNTRAIQSDAALPTMRKARRKMIIMRLV